MKTFLPPNNHNNRLQNCYKKIVNCNLKFILRIIIKNNCWWWLLAACLSGPGTSTSKVGKMSVLHQPLHTESGWKKTCKTKNYNKIKERTMAYQRCWHVSGKVYFWWCSVLQFTFSKLRKQWEQVTFCCKDVISVVFVYKIFSVKKLKKIKQT